jgi:hypothetical protein
MSEYQYHEWQTIDRPLTDKEQAQVNKLSSHIDVRSTGAWVEYSWGDFKHNPRQVLADYFDAYRYMANWGSRELMFRFPKTLLDRRLVDPYCLEYCVDLSAVDDYWILSIALGDDEGASDWIEGSGWLSALAPLRNDILLGDMRALYLAWLANVDYVDVAEDDLEPPVPAGLAKLTAPLNRLVRFLEVDKHLLKTAAAGSSDQQSTPDHVLRGALARLPRGECDEILWRLAQGELNLGPRLLRRLHELIGSPDPIEQPRRTVGDLLAARDRLAKAEQQKQRRAAEAKRIQELEALAQREATVWQEVDQLIQTSQAKAYKEAVRLLEQLRNLADYQGTQVAFEARLRQLTEQYARRHSLIAALKAAGLMPP